ncbi:hypothetical protein [Streptomyces fulvorobeus]|uniref:ATP-binding protein n=1 Tax=Streptomyces fulvorobeus TaxID=284028 RepID=A0A7J0C8Z3_9ACTN|nr:hypothetical protein [Streptomyces fulvorobeus]NYE42588.1 hypothetical protein [Streptomyces fulvorobeus]GFM98995.1 hypothetical protein Sfulv_38060 [Streptomyces fulvorobeus]
MKQSAVRTLGVAALGAAFAAAGSSSASALPVDATATSVPAASALDAVSHAAPTVQDSAGELLRGQNVGGEVAAPVTGLLGGLPTKGVAANGLPIGG